MVKAPVWTLLALAVVACTTDSTDLTTHNISAGFTVTLNDDPNATTNTVVEASLRDASTVSGDPHYVNLTGSDALSLLTDKNDNLPMPRTGDGAYSVTLPNVDRTSFTFKLARSSGASATVFKLQDPLAMTDSPAGKIYSANASVHFAWSNPSSFGALSLSASHYACNGVTLSNDIVKDLPYPDSGTLDIPVTKLFSSGTPTADCLTISIERAYTQPADAALASSSGVTGRRTDRFKIQVQ